ncbi:MAG TPA: hypothetical protein VFN09_08595, partial [Rhodanobacteraceae bacterium]|nr:hypothetical protein [Rhodanobacteraceae bacterium]
AIVVGEPVVMARLRRLRRMAGVAPDPLQQRAWGYFLSMGHYATALQRARRELTARRVELRDALNHYLHDAVKIQTVDGASAYWVCCRDGRDARALAVRAANAGVLIQPARLDAAQDGFAMGVTSVPRERIREGVRMLARLVRAEATRAEHGDAATTTLKPLAGTALRRAIAGKTFLYNTVYGEPCTITVRRTGALVGVAGYAGDDPDRGRWWIEGDRWFRQWEHWAYGEAEGFHVACDGVSLYWYDVSGKLVDKAVLLQSARPQPD